MVNMHGGLEAKNGHDFANSYDLSLELDFGKMNLVPGGSFFLRRWHRWIRRIVKSLHNLIVPYPEVDDGLLHIMKNWHALRVNLSG